MEQVKLVAEIGINHDGDMETCFYLIDIAKTCGCDYVKFQKRTVEDVYTPEELAKPRESKWGNTTRDQKMGLEFTVKEYDAIDADCSGKISWFASPWDAKSVHFLATYNVPYFKVASAVMTDRSVFEAMNQYPKVPIILSTGMCTEGMIYEAVNYFGTNRIEYILHCTSTYPSIPEEQGLLYIKSLKLMYPSVKIGFSNHSPGILFATAAVAFGAEMIETHITYDRAAKGSDHAASWEPGMLYKFGKKYIPNLHTALGNGLKEIYDSERPMEKKLRRFPSL
jgi:N-acetylneuraminate synthase